jgi:hypothetical protein
MYCGRIVQIVNAHTNCFKVEVESHRYEWNVGEIYEVGYHNNGMVAFEKL